MLNPLRSEEEAFRFLLYVLAVIVVLIVGRGRCVLSRGSSARADRPLARRAAPRLFDGQRAVHPAARWPGTWQKNV